MLCRELGRPQTLARAKEALRSEPGGSQQGRVACGFRGLSSLPRCSIFTSSDLYAPPQHVDPLHSAWWASEAILTALRGRNMQDPASELRRTPLPRTPVNKGKREGRGPGLRRTRSRRTRSLGKPAPPAPKLCSTYNTKEYEPSPLGRTPKPDGAMEGFRLPEVLCDNCVGHRTGVSGVGAGLCTNPRP